MLQELGSYLLFKLKIREAVRNFNVLSSFPDQI